ncbi:MAG: GNAT family N-acetyltransferase, partial [Candidatus Omnitrophota bacterium]|nr:GNAT family N-acetyltransferase [Candidatus Omnitrophota bacterium]
FKDLLPSVILHACTNNPKDPRAFLRNLIKAQAEISKEPEFKDLLPSAILHACTSNPKDPRTFLRNLIKTQDGAVARQNFASSPGETDAVGHLRKAGPDETPERGDLEPGGPSRRFLKQPQQPKNDEVAPKGPSPEAHTIKKTVYGKTYELPKRVYDNVRLARTEDASDIDVLSKLIWHADGPSRAKFYEEEIENKRADVRKNIWVYCDDAGKVRGYIYATFFPGIKSASIWEIAVSKRMQGRHIAKALMFVAMEYMENVFSATKFDTWPLDESNKVITHLIEEFGFKYAGHEGLDGPAYYKADFTSYIEAKYEQEYKEFASAPVLPQAIRSIILARRSTRHFDQGKIPDKRTIKVLVDNSVATLSQRYDMEDIEVSIYDDPIIRQRLGTEIKGLRQEGELKKDVQPQPKDAPFSIVVSVRENALKADRGKTLSVAGMLIETILLSATSAGVDSLWISSFDELKAKEICGDMSSPFIPIAIIPLGYRSQDPRPPRRLPAEIRIKNETYSHSSGFDEEALLREARKVNKINGAVAAAEIGNSGNGELTAVLSDNPVYPKAINILSHRYGNAPPPELSNNGIDSALKGAIEAAQWAPSARNLQSTDFIIIKERDRIKNICKALAIDHSTIKAMMIPIGNIERLKLIGKTNSNNTSTEARARELFIYLDGGAATQNILFSLVSAGYSAEWIFKKDISGHIFKELGIPVDLHEYLGVITIKDVNVDKGTTQTGPLPLVDEKGDGHLRKAGPDETPERGDLEPGGPSRHFLKQPQQPKNDEVAPDTAVRVICSDGWDEGQTAEVAEFMVDEGLIEVGDKNAPRESLVTAAMAQLHPGLLNAQERRDTVFAALKGNKVAGCVKTSMDLDREGEVVETTLVDLYVGKDYRGDGVGKGLVAAAEDHLLKKGITAYMVTPEDTDEAQKFWKARIPGRSRSLDKNGRLVTSMVPLRWGIKYNISIPEIKIGNFEVQWPDIKSTMDETGQYITPEQERIVFHALHAKNLTLDQRNEIRYFIIEKYKWLIDVVIKKKMHIHGKQEKRDAREEGELGILRAIVTFDPKRGNRFSSYASFWIRSALQRSPLLEETIHKPAYLEELIKRYKDVRRKLWQELRRDPTLKEIASKLRVPLKIAKKIQAAASRMKSLDVFTRNPKARFEMRRNIVPAKEEDLKDISPEDIPGLLSCLDSREREVIEKRYRVGAKRDISYTRKEIGRALGVTEERVRQIEIKALWKMQKQAKAMSLVANPDNNGNGNNGNEKLRPRMTKDKAPSDMPLGARFAVTPEDWLGSKDKHSATQPEKLHRGPRADQPLNGIGAVGPIKPEDESADGVTPKAADTILPSGRGNGPQNMAGVSQGDTSPRSTKMLEMEINGKPYAMAAITKGHKANYIDLLDAIAEEFGHETGRLLQRNSTIKIVRGGEEYFMQNTGIDGRVLGYFSLLKAGDSITIVNGKRRGVPTIHFLRNIVDTKELTQNMIEGILSALFSNKEVTLAFNKKLKGLESAELRAMMAQLNKWKEATARKNPKMRELLSRFRAFEYDDLKTELNKRGIDANAENSLIFNYAPKPENEPLDSPGSAIRPVYIIEQEESFAENYYYPLLEMVTISVAKELLQWNDAELRAALAASNIDTEFFGIDPVIDEKTGILIFKVLPKMERYDNNSRIDRYTRLLQFIRSA